MNYKFLLLQLVIVFITISFSIFAQSDDYKFDGENMVIEASASSSYGDMSETMVYDKQ